MPVDDLQEQVNEQESVMRPQADIDARDEIDADPQEIVDKMDKEAASPNDGEWECGLAAIWARR